MEETSKKQNNHSFTKFKNCWALKMLSKFLAPVCFFSLMVSCSSLLFLVFNLVEFLTCNVHKNYMFLLCNGILAFLVKKSGLFCGNSDHQEMNFNNVTSSLKVPELSETKPEIAEEKVVMEVKEEREMEGKSLILVTETENAPLITEDAEGEQENKSVVLDTEEEEQEEEEEEEEATELLSTEELNRKCEDFIRKMRDFQFQS